MRVYKNARMNLKIKNMKNNALPKFESVVTNEKTKFVIQSATEAYRTTDGTSRRKTHSLILHTSSGSLSWVNENGRTFTHIFESPEIAQQWWNQMVLPRAVQKQAAANEMDR